MGESGAALLRKGTARQRETRGDQPTHTSRTCIHINAGVWQTGHSSFWAEQSSQAQWWPHGTAACDLGLLKLHVVWPPMVDSGGCGRPMSNCASASDTTAMGSDDGLPGATGATATPVVAAPASDEPADTCIPAVSSLGRADEPLPPLRRHLSRRFAPAGRRTPVPAPSLPASLPPPPPPALPCAPPPPVPPAACGAGPARCSACAASAAAAHSSSTLAAAISPVALSSAASTRAFSSSAATSAACRSRCRPRFFLT